MTYKEMIQKELGACAELGIFSKAQVKKAIAYIETEMGNVELEEYSQSGCRISDAADLLVQTAKFMRK